MSRVEPGADPGFPVRGVPTLGGGANLQHRCFSVKTYVKMKEFGPVGGGRGRAPETFVCRSATEFSKTFHRLGIPHRRILVKVCDGEAILNPRVTFTGYRFVKDSCTQ